MLNIQSPMPDFNAEASGITRFNPRAVSLFSEAWRNGQGRRLIGAVLRRSRRLPLLEAPAGSASSPRDGVRPVPLAHIRGSINRANDFDCDFYPLDESLRNRWVRVASMMLLGTALPPVELVQVGEVYYVEDGHHRISVARMLGYSAIDAVILRAYTS
jgi:hypothetical protein